MRGRLCAPRLASPPRAHSPTPPSPFRPAPAALLTPPRPHCPAQRSYPPTPTPPPALAPCAQIVTEVTHSKGFSLVDSLEGARLESLVARLIKPIDIPKGNGRLARNLVERAISRQTDRIFVVIKEAGTVAQVPQPPPPTLVTASAGGLRDSTLLTSKHPSEAWLRSSKRLTHEEQSQPPEALATGWCRPPPTKRTPPPSPALRAR